MFDIFISYASEDKNIFVRSLAKRLTKKNVSVWYDEFSLKIGDSLRQSLNYGLSNSRFGVVVLSKDFFSKKWTNWELDGLTQIENSKNKFRILPIWLGISYSDIIDYSPSLADKYAIKAELGLDYVVRKIIEKVKPQDTSIEIASRKLKNLGYDVPPPNNEWWLDVVDYEGNDSNAVEWAFSVGYLSSDNDERGSYLANKVVQMIWQDIVRDKRISQITHPNIVLDEISKVSGLKELLLENIDTIICYTPQLTIKGYGGLFENKIEEYYQLSLKKYHEDKGRKYLCDEEIALRNPQFGLYRPSSITCNFVQGQLFGLSPKKYENIDYLIWLLSEDSNWLPSKIKEYLLLGFKDWDVWIWADIDSEYQIEYGRNENVGSLLEEMYKAGEENRDIIIDSKCIEDIKACIECSKWKLELSDNTNSIYKRFIEVKFIEAVIKNEKSRKSKQKKA